MQTHAHRRAHAYPLLHHTPERAKQSSDILLHHVSWMQHRSGKMNCDCDYAKMRWHYPSKLWLRSQSNLRHHWRLLVFNWGSFRWKHDRERIKCLGMFWVNHLLWSESIRNFNGSRGLCRTAFTDTQPWTCTHVQARANLHFLGNKTQSLTVHLK